MARYFDKHEVAEQLAEIAAITKDLHRQMDRLWRGTECGSAMEARLNAVKSLYELDVYGIDKDALHLAQELTDEAEADPEVETRSAA